MGDPKDKLAEHWDFLERMKQLEKSPVQMNSDLAKNLVKDLPVDKIKTNLTTPVENAFVHQAKIEALKKASKPAGSTLDYNQLRKEFMQKAKAEKTGKLAKVLSGSKKLGMGIGPLGAIAGLAAAGSTDEALANALIPGGVEGVGAGSDMPMQDDTPQIQMAAESAVDPNVRRMALQELRNRNR